MHRKSHRLVSTMSLHSALSSDDSRHAVPYLTPFKSLETSKIPTRQTPTRTCSLEQPSYPAVLAIQRKRGEGNKTVTMNQITGNLSLTFLGGEHRYERTRLLVWRELGEISRNIQKMLSILTNCGVFFGASWQRLV